MTRTNWIQRDNDDIFLVRNYLFCRKSYFSTGPHCQFIGQGMKQI